ncbi:MAG TPA: PKD domain-containing protein, partial [Thermoplasmata archaeon]|nr:PKD domain-containing protein [Thermoplasmata archaeon]
MPQNAVRAAAIFVAILAANVVYIPMLAAAVGMNFYPDTNDVAIGSGTGTFPDDILGSDDTRLSYAEGDARIVTQDYIPSSETIVKGVEGFLPSYKQGTFTRKSDGVGLQAVTGIGFQGRALILWWTRQTTSGTIAGHSAGIGLVSTPTQQYAIAWADNDAASPSNSGRRAAAAAIVILGSGTPAVDGEAVFIGFTPDGWTIEWTTNPSPAHATQIHFIVLGGSVTDAFVGQFVGPVAGFTGLRSYPGVGFQGDLVIFMGNTMTALGSASHATMGFGAATSALDRGAASIGLPDGTTTADTEAVHDRRALITYNPALPEPTTDQIIDFSSRDGDGFTLNHLKTLTGNVLFWAMVIKGGNYKSGFLTKPTSTGDQVVSGVGFQPAGVLFWGIPSSKSFGVEDAGAEFTIGAGSEDGGSVVQDGTWLGSDDSVNPTNTNMNTSRSRVIVDLNLGSLGIQNDGRYKASHSDGFVLNWAKVSTSVHRYFYIGMGATGGEASDTQCAGPTELASAATLGDTINDNTRVVFRNPRGLQQRYVIYKDTLNGDLVYRFSESGCQWSGKQVISSATPSNFEVAVHDSGSDFRVYFAVVESSVVKYRMGVVADSSSFIAFEPEIVVRLVTQTLMERPLAVSIARTYNGRLVVAYATDITVAGRVYRTTHLIGSTDDGPAPAWAGDILWDNPSSSVNNANKDEVYYSVASFGPTYPNRFLFAASVPESTDTVHSKVVTADAEWNGATFTRTGPTLLRETVEHGDSLACIVDANQVAHCLVEDTSDLFSAKATSPGTDDWAGLSSVVDVANESGRSTLSIDSSRTPNVLYAIYDKSSTGPLRSTTDFFYKTSPVDTISWSAETTVSYPQDVEDIVSATRDSLDGIHVAGERAGDVVFYHEIKLSLPPPPPTISSFPSCVQASDNSSCLYSETEDGPGGPFRVEVMYSWADIDIAGAEWRLFLDGRQGASDPETIEVRIFDSFEVPSDVATCSIISSTDVLYDCGTLTEDQLDGGFPDILFIDRDTSADGGQSTFFLDQVFIRRVFGLKQLEVRFSWSGIPQDGASYELRVEGYVTDEVVAVQVLTPPDVWTTRLTIAATTDTDQGYFLEAVEFNQGSPSVRFVDTSSTDATTSLLRLDHVRVVKAGFLAADFTYDPASPVAGDDITFTATASGGTPPYSFAWSFGDAASGTGNP